jgi:hypothetical protein
MFRWNSNCTWQSSVNISPTQPVYRITYNISFQQSVSILSVISFGQIASSKFVYPPLGSGDTVHLVCRPLLYQRLTRNAYGAFDGMRIDRGRRNTQRRATLFATNPIWLDLGSNPGRRSEKPAWAVKRPQVIRSFWLHLLYIYTLWSPNYCNAIVLRVVVQL